MNALHLAVSTDRMDTVRWLVGHGVNLNATDKKLRTPLHYAALRGLRAICEFLVNSGARVTAVDFVGNTPEVGHHDACSCSHKDFISTAGTCDRRGADGRGAGTLWLRPRNNGVNELRAFPRRAMNHVPHRAWCGELPYCVLRCHRASGDCIISSS